MNQSLTNEGQCLIRTEVTSSVYNAKIHEYIFNICKHKELWNPPACKIFTDKSARFCALKNSNCTDLLLSKLNYKDMNKAA